MRNITLTILIISLTSCYSQQNSKQFESTKVSFDSMALNSDKNIQGSILIFDLENDTYYSNDFNWAEVGRIPASTFKIPHSLIALELGIIKDSNSILKWNGEPRYLKTWEQDLTFQQAFHYSCVPCYQQIARKAGIESMSKFMKQFNYGQMDIAADNIDGFWLVGDSKISQFEEIDFLKQLYLSKLPISKRTEKIFKQMFIIKQTDEYSMRAKTGLSINNGRYNGWYVGYIETPTNVYFFATNISPTKGKHDKHDKSFNKKRKDITIKAFKQLGII